MHVCSETNLRNAELFKGVIFCKNCSQRIFEDLSTTRKRARPKRNRNENRVLEMAQNITSSSEKSMEASKLPSRRSTPMNIRTINTDNKVNLKKSSNERGTTTLVTGELLRNLQLPERFDTDARSKPTKKQKRYKYKKSKKPCSDLRIAELGKSTEIAQMILRKSAMPVVIKSDSPEMNFIAKRSKSLCLTDGSETSAELPLSSFDSGNSKTLKPHWMDRRLRSFIKLPYISFKKKILAKSSLVSAVMSHEKTNCLFNRIRRTFNEEITEHQRRGLKKLFSTINKRKTQHKLGWLEKKKIKNGVENRNNSSESKSSESKRCKHFYNCHSYRCMRARVMQRAGPTDSQLRMIRQKIKHFICHDLTKGTLRSGKKYIELFVSQA
nr:uncharacterized protein LOC116776618 isoform X3 [Danaus plexippus plexippus]